MDIGLRVDPLPFIHPSAPSLQASLLYTNHVRDFGPDSPANSGASPANPAAYFGANSPANSGSAIEASGPHIL